MRLLTSNKMLSLLEALPAERSKAVERFDGVAPLLFDTSQLERLTAEGFLQAIIIRLDGVPLYCVWLHCTVDRGLHVNCVVRLSGNTGDTFGFLVSTLEGYAKSRGCTFLRFNTKRAGLAALATQDYGYEIDSLCLTKKF